MATLGFLWAAICLWLMSWQSFDSAKLVLGAACFSGVLLGCFAIGYLLKSKAYMGNYALYDDSMNRNLYWLFIMVIVGIVLLALLGLVNAIKKGNLHFIFAILLLFWIFITVCFLGLLWRGMR